MLCLIPDKQWPRCRKVEHPFQQTLEELYWDPTFSHQHSALRQQEDRERLGRPMKAQGDRGWRWLPVDRERRLPEDRQRRLLQEDRE